jgi:hypothetical protein
MRFILDPLKFVHSVNRLSWLGNKECLASRGVKIRIFDVGEMEGPETAAVHKKGRRWVIL